MGIEKPITTIKKAVQGQAEKMAAKEFLDKPEQRHYNDVFRNYKITRAFNPESVEEVIKIDARDKELKDEMGKELYKVFNQVLEEVSNSNKSQLNEAVKQIKRTANPEELNQEIIKLHVRFFKEKTSEFKNDSRIVSAFVGKENLLNKGIDYMISTTLFLMDDYLKTPPLKLMSMEELQEKMLKMKKGGLTGTERREEMLEKNKLEEGLSAKIIKFFRSIN